MSNQVDSLRVEYIREEMERANLDAIVVRLAENVLALTGYFPVVGYAAAVVSRTGEAIVIAPEQERENAREGWASEIREFAIWDIARPDPPPRQVDQTIAAALANADFPLHRVGYEGNFDYIAPPILAAEPVIPTERSKAHLAANLPNSTLVDATNAIDRIRSRKTPRDAALLRRVNEVAGFGYEALRQVALDGGTEADAAGAFQQAVTARGIGHDGARFAMAWPQVSTGVKTGDWAYYLPTGTNRIEEGHLVLCETAVCVDGYWADLTRTFVVGDPTDRQREVWETTYTALQTGIEAVRPGVPAAEVDRAARDKLGDLLPYLSHHIGHGLGWKYHEPLPSLMPHSEHVLEEGMYMAIEPAAYIPGWGGVRHEENVLVTHDGYDVVSDCIPCFI